MRKMLILVLLAVILLPLASAETYRISGTVKFANGTPMTLDYVSVACPEDEINAFNTVESMLELMLMDISR